MPRAFTFNPDKLVDPVAMAEPNFAVKEVLQVSQRCYITSTFASIRIYQLSLDELFLLLLNFKQILNFKQSPKAYLGAQDWNWRTTSDRAQDGVRSWGWHNESKSEWYTADVGYRRPLNLTLPCPTFNRLKLKLSTSKQQYGRHCFRGQPNPRTWLAKRKIPLDILRHASLKCPFLFYMIR